jgi:GNAT superfamily N-acetyltransferase
MMLTYRTFRNVDPPALTAIWRSRAHDVGLLQPVSADLFEQLVFAKLYFDYEGLILAWDDGQPVGFAHSGFGPNETRDAISTDSGVTCLVLVRPEYAEAEVADGLLEHCEAYLRRRGAKVLYGGGVCPLNPFYVGLYGGSQLPGVLDSDAVARQLYSSHGYEELRRTLIFERDLTHFEAMVDRRQMEIRRRTIVQVTGDPPSRTWWEACTLGEFELTRFDVMPRGSTAPVAWAIFRSMELCGPAGIGRATGLIELHVEPSMRRRGVATYLLSEAFRQFIRQNVLHVEAQIMPEDPVAAGLMQKLGFRQSAQGSVFRKSG